MIEIGFVVKIGNVGVDVLFLCGGISVMMSMVFLILLILLLGGLLMKFNFI